MVLAADLGTGLIKRVQTGTNRMAITRQSLVTLAIALCLAFSHAAGGAQDAPPSAPAKPDDAKSLADYVDLVELRVVGADEPTKPIAKPLFRYDDRVRQIAEGGIWAWGDGRPVAMIKSWRNADGRRTRAFSLTSDEIVAADGPQARAWRPESTQAEPKPLPDAPAPDRSETVRLRQLKEQARRFSAYEMWDPENQRFEMRLLVQPVHRYHDKRRQILDGAVFLLAVDNNPQIVLLIEMLAAEANGSRWQYLLARVCSAELHVMLDGREVFSEGRTTRIVGEPNGPYWHMVTMPVGGKAP
jgi:hypothetical protein